MVHDWIGILKIAITVGLVSLAIAGAVAFYEGREAGKRTLLPILYLSTLIGALQIIKTQYLHWLLLLYASIGAFFLWRKRWRGK